MHLHRGLATRALILAAAGALSVSSLSSAADAGSSPDAAENPPTEQLLVHLGQRVIDPNQATIVRELGSGWVLVSSTSEQPDLGSALNDLGFGSESNTIYQLTKEPLFGDQWGLENSGQLGDTTGSGGDSSDG